MLLDSTSSTPLQTASSPSTTASSTLFNLASPTAARKASGNLALRCLKHQTSVHAMYYPQQSPGIAHKLASHHDQSSWPRPHHPVLGPPGSQPSAGPPPPSPGYAIYTNGNVNPMQHHPHHPHPLPMQHHHHQNSLSHYPSPPNGHSHQQHVLSQGSPASAGGQIISPHWQQQLLKCEVRILCFYQLNPYIYN